MLAGAPLWRTGGAIADQLISIRKRGQGRGGHPIRHAAIAALERVEERLVAPDRLLRDDADALYHPAGERENIPQALFYEATAIKADQERAARERRLAAWLYLEHRVRARTLDDADPQRTLWRDLGETVQGDLWLSPDKDDQALAKKIEESLG